MINSLKIKVFKIRQNAKIPQKSYSGDAGYDLFYCPIENTIDSDIIINPHQSVIIPTGIKLFFADYPDYMIEIKNRSGNAAKKQLIVGSCIIDSGYTGEILVNLHNIGEKSQLIVSNDKIAQMIPIYIGNSELIEVYQEEITSRGASGFGSTDCLPL